MKSQICWDYWVDFAKFFACFLVAIGHLIQGLVHAGLISKTNQAYLIFDGMVYLFHVPVFFFCSGYLYQKTALVNNLKSYRNNISKKFINLGVLYFTFSGITILLKIIFSDSVNTKFEDDIFTTLIFHPIAPYWFLYALFFLFLVCPTIQSIKSACFLLAISILLKILEIFEICLPYPVSYIQGNLIWFGSGIIFIRFNLARFMGWKIVLVSTLFIPVSLLVILQDSLNNAIRPLLTFCGILMSISFFFVASRQSWFPLEIMKNLSKWTIHIYVLHKIASATFRTILIKTDIHFFTVHIIVGIIASIAVPIAVGYFCQKFALLNFFFEPMKTIKSLKRLSGDKN